MRSRNIAVVTIALLTFLAYAGDLYRGPFGVNDDYQYLQRVYTGTFDPGHNEQTAMGRPAAAWLLEAGYALCNGLVANLVYLRLVGLVGIVLWTSTLFLMLRQRGERDGAAFVVAACVALCPASGVYSAWAAAFLAPYALTLCLLAGWLLQRSPVRLARRLIFAAAAGLLILFSCTLWQAAAPLALLAGFVEVWRRTGRGQPLWAAVRSSHVGSAWIVIACTMLLYLLGQRLLERSGWVHGEGLARTALATDFGDKMLFLFTLLRSGLASWGRLHAPGWQLAVAVPTLLAVAAAILNTGQKRSPGQTVCRALFAGVMLVASVSPLLAAREDNASFRSLPVLYTVVLLLAVDGGARCLERVRPRIAQAAGAGLIILAALSAGYHVRAGIVDPNTREYRSVSRLVGQQFHAMPSPLVYLVPSPVLLAPKTINPSWEYGIISSPFSWVTQPFLLLIFHEHGLCAEPRSDRLLLYYREKDHPGVPVLNPLAEMLHRAGVWRVDAQWGRVQDFGDGWLYSPWFGYLNVSRFPVIQHQILGALLSVEGKTDDLWLYKEGLGVFYTSQESFPYLYVTRRKSWVFLLDTDRSHCAVRDPNGRRWLLSGEGSDHASLAEYRPRRDCESASPLFAAETRHADNCGFAVHLLACTAAAVAL